MKNIPAIASIIGGVLFIALAAYYWMTPAGSLLAFVPGFEAGSTAIHFKHGLAALLVGCALFAYAWFASGPSKTSA